MKNLSIYLLCLLIAVLPGCMGLSPQQQESGRISIDNAYKRGELSKKQRDDAVDALENSNFDITPWLAAGGSVLASIILGVPISVGQVMKKRGPVRQQPVA
jgi:hypothetical protein